MLRKLAELLRAADSSGQLTYRQCHRRHRPSRPWQDFYAALLTKG